MKPLQVNAIAEQVTEFGGRMNEMAEDVRTKLNTAQTEMGKNFRRAKAKADDLLEEGRHEIKMRPVAAVSTFMVAGAVLGFAAGILVGRKKCS